MKNRRAIDRRSGTDRRQVYDMKYFESDGEERRLRLERRRSDERREDWARINTWSSTRRSSYSVQQPVKLFKIP